MTKRVIFAVLVAAVLMNCATLRAQDAPVSNRAETPLNSPVDSLGRSDSTLFFYVEGLKKLHIYRDAGDAWRYFDRAIDIDSLHAPSYYEMGNAMAPFNPQWALEASEKANALDSTNFWYKVQLSRLLVANKHYDRAQKTYEWLIGIAPHVPDNYSMLAALYEFAAQPFSAIAILEKGERALGKLEYLSEHKRELLIKMGLYDRAIEEGVELAENYPYNYENYLALAQLYAETKRDSLAKLNFNRALELNPDGLDVLAAVADFHSNTGDNVSFLATTKQLVQREDVSLEQKINLFSNLTANKKFYGENYFAIKDIASTLFIQYPNEYVVLKIYADNMLAWGDYDGVVELYKEYIKRNDTLSFVSPYTEIIGIESYLQRAESVKQYYKQGEKRFPRSSELHISAGWAMSNLENQQRASIKAFEKAYKYAPTDSVRSVIRGTLGDMQYQNGERKKGYESYQKAIELWANNVVVLNNYAYFLSEEDRELEKALWMSRRVMELEPGNATYIDTYAWILYKLEFFEEAKRAMQQAIALDTSKSSLLFLHYGDILYALGEHYMASIYWTRALDAGHSAQEIEQRRQLPKSKIEE